MNAKSTFSVITQSSLSSDDFKVLSLLYQPVIGIFSHSLYLTLYQLVNRSNYQSKNHTHQFLSDLLNEKVANLLDAREKLEALNLLETHKKDNHYIYQIKAPLSPRGFIKDTILGQFLLSEVGSKIYKDLIELFKVEKIEITGYEQITKQFDDLYSFKPLLNFKDDATYLGKRVNTGANISYQLNYDAFVEKLPNRLKKPSLMNHKTQDLIQKLVFIYQFSLDEIVEIYESASDSHGEVPLEQLQLKAQMYYIDYKQDLPIVQTKVTDDKKDLIHYLKTETPMRVITNYAKNDYQAMSTDTVIELINRNNVEIGIINVMLMHVLKKKEGVLPHINYLEKVLETWIKKGITTTELAYEYVSKIDSIPKKTKKTSSSNPDNTDEWIDKYWDDLDNVEVE